MGGATGIWPCFFFSSTDCDEISIFGLNKDQTFRIWSPFMDPEQILILVTYLFFNKNSNTGGPIICLFLIDGLLYSNLSLNKMTKLHF
jgi:hypothetical protein